MEQLNIGDEVVVYGRGRIRAVEETNVYAIGGNKKVVVYSIDYPDDAGFARVTAEVIERAGTDDRDQAKK